MKTGNEGNRAMTRRLLPLLFLLLPGAALADLSGDALVMDGDTLTVAEQDIHLIGVHAPTIAQYCGEGEAMWPCGWDAANRLEAIIDGREVVCTDVEPLDETHATGRCSVDGEDLAGLMVDEGFAVADEATGTDYMARQQVASEAGVGIWSGPFVDPVTWAEIGDCGCTARKQSMMETAAALKAEREAAAAAAAGTVIEDEAAE